MPSSRAVFPEKIEVIKIIVAIVNQTAIDLETLHRISLFTLNVRGRSDDVIGPSIFSRKLKWRNQG